MTAMLPKTELISTASGQFLTLSTDTVISNQLRTKGHFEKHLVKLGEAIQRSQAGSIIIDVGANIGTFSIPIAIATGCEVHAFEAQRIMSQILSANFVINRIDNGHVHHVILDSEFRTDPRDLPIPDYEMPGNFGAYSTVPELFERESLARMEPSALVDHVQVATLDNYNLRNISLLKLDVEGAELNVLKGSTHTLINSSFPPIIFESWRDEWWSDQRREIINYLDSLGYSIQRMDENYLAQHKSTPDSKLIKIKYHV